MKPLCAALMFALALVPSVEAGSPMPVQMKCAVGGQKFTYISTASMSRWGARPDGKPYGSWTFPIPLPECPGNGLVMYRDFTREEVKVLKGLLESPEYQQLRTDRETGYYRASWLMSKLGDAPLDRAWVVQQASWEADGQPQRKSRYQEEFVQLVRELPRPEAGQDDLDWIVVQMRAVNALRELGRFDEALQLLESLPLASLDVAVPAEKVSGTTPSGLGKQVENYAEIQAAQSRRSWMGYAAKQRVVIGRRDTSSEPLDLVPSRIAAQLCETHPDTAPGYKEVCESGEVQQIRERRRKNREQAVPPAPPPVPPADPAKPN